MHLIKPVRLIPWDMPFEHFKQCFSETTQHYFPVIDASERLVGIFSINDVRGVLFAPEIEHLVVMNDIGTADIIKTTPAEDLNTVLQKFTTKNIDGLPVVRAEEPNKLIGMLNRREVIAFYNQKVAELKAQQSEAA
jgi:CIC family chloride channel protein